MDNHLQPIDRVKKKTRLLYIIVGYIGIFIATLPTLIAFVEQRWTIELIGEIIYSWLLLIPGIILLCVGHGWSYRDTTQLIYKIIRPLTLRFWRDVLMKWKV